MSPTEGLAALALVIAQQALRINELEAQLAQQGESPSEPDESRWE